ncbi:MAG: hypothetical protein ABIS14_07940 [Sphingomonas sp.]
MIPRAPLIMAAVAGVSAIGAGVVLTRPARGEGSVYARRIAGTMLGAFAVILGGFAYALWSWGASA